MPRPWVNARLDVLANDVHAIAADLGRLQFTHLGLDSVLLLGQRGLPELNSADSSDLCRLGSSKCVVLCHPDQRLPDKQTDLVGGEPEWGCDPYR
jgi:hypothetical protein